MNRYLFQYRDIELAPDDAEQLYDALLFWLCSTKWMDDEA